MSRPNSKASEGLNECTNCDGYGKEECDNCIPSGNSFVVRCPECDGYGKDDNDDTCGECGGDGEVLCDVCDNTGEITCNVCGGIGEVNESKASLKAMKASGAGDMIDDIPDGMDLDEWLGESKASESTWHIEIEDFSRDSGKNTYDLTLGSQATEEDVKEKLIGMYTDAGFQYSREDINDPLVTKITKTGESKASEDYFEDENGNVSSVMKWKLVYDDGSDYGFQTDNKAEAQRAVDQWNETNSDRPIKIISQESKASESISDNDKQILGDWVSQNRDWTTIDDLPDEIFIPLMAPFGDDIDKRVEAQVEIINYMKSLGESDMVSESWSQKSSINRIEALERVGVKQGDAIKLSSLEFDDFGEDLQGALKGDVEDARDLMNKEKDFLDKNQEELDIEQNSTGMPWQQGGEVDNPNSEFQQSYPDYNNIGESQTNMTSYECQYCDSGFKSNEALSVHHNDKHAIAPESFDGYANEGHGLPYAIGDYTDWFSQAWGDDADQSAIPNTVQCEYCFDQFNVEDQEGMISHINSKHDADVDPVNGDTNKSWGESKASEARKLNARQKKLIEEWVGSMSSPPMMITSDDLPYSLLSELRDINDFDGFDSAIMRYASDIGNKQAMQGSNPYMHSSNYGSFESKASEFNIGTTMICPICKKEIEAGNEDSFYHDGNFYDPNSVPMSYKMQDHFEQEHTAEDFGVQNKNFKGASDGFEAFEDWKTGNQLSLAFRNSFPEYNQDDAIMMAKPSSDDTLDSDGNRMPDEWYIEQWKKKNGITESKASEYGDAIHSEDGNGWDQGGFFFGIPNMTRDDYEGTVYWKGTPVEHYDHDYFGGDGFEQDMEKDARRLAEKCKDLESRGITPTTSSILSGESKSNEAGSEDHMCAECGFVTSDNSEYLDHLNSHEE